MNGDVERGDAAVEEDHGNGTSTGDYEDHLARSQRVWDRWSERYSLSERDFESNRIRAIEHLDLAPGDRVLDVGCGPGVNFEHLRDAVGPDGEVVGVDFSPKMVERARERAAEHEWSTVEVRQGDATTADLGSGFDAAIATLSLSVMPDVDRAVENVHSALAQDGRLAVFDLRAVPSGPARILNPPLRWSLRWVANWNPDGDVVEALSDGFRDFEIVETSAAGAAYTAVASDGRPWETRDGTD